MYPGDFEKLFNQISDIFTLDLISEERDLEQNFPKRNKKTPIWDSIMSTNKTSGFIDIGGKRFVSYTNFFKTPVRILFFVMITEFESRLFRISEWSGKSISELNEQNLNTLIRYLIDSDLVELQTEYETRGELKEDLKAISSFRNVVVHVNKKLEKDVSYEILVKRKSQIIKVLSALQQILDGMEIDHRKKINLLSQEEMIELKKSIGSLEKSIREIYSTRGLRSLTGEQGIVERTLGDNFVNLNNYKKTYFDKRRGLEVKTELAEVIEAFDEYDKNPTQDNKIKLLLEVGDFIFQRQVASIYHKSDQSYGEFINRIDECLSSFKANLEKRGLSIELSEKLIRIKQGSRAWLRKRGAPEKAKDKKLEYELCKEELERIESENKLTN